MGHGWKGKAGRVVGLAVAAGGSLLLTWPALAGGDFFAGLASSIDAAGRIWGPALLVLAALIAGGAIAMGSHNSGEKVRNFLLGAIFLVMAAAGGAALLSKLQALLS